MVSEETKAALEDCLMDLCMNLARTIADQYRAQVPIERASSVTLELARLSADQFCDLLDEVDGQSSPAELRAHTAAILVERAADFAEGLLCNGLAN